MIARWVFKRSGVLVVAAVVSSCAPKPVVVPKVEPRELVILAADPETGAVGQATVTTPEGTVSLTQAGEGSDVRAGAAPGTPTARPADEIQRLFGDTLAAMPLAAQRFILYFEPGATTLTAESRARLPEVVAAVRSRVAVEVSVIGHTDTTGTAATNVEVGLSRATLIRDVLIAEGISDQVITVASHGESNPVVSTPDDADEPRNRRVEVTVR